MSIISRLQSLQPFAVHTVETEDLGPVLLKAMDGDEITAHFSAGKEAATDTIRLLALTLCNEDGSRVFKVDAEGKLPEDVRPLFGKVLGSTFVQLVGKAVEINRLGDDAKKDSKPNPG